MAGGGFPEALGVPQAGASHSTCRFQRTLGAERDRSLRARATGEGTLVAPGGGGSLHARAATSSGSDGPAALLGRSAGLCERRFAERLRETGGPPARLAALRRAHGARLAGPRALRGFQRLPGRSRPLHLAPIANGSSTPSTATSPSTSSPSSSSPATCCQSRRWSSRSPPASIATPRSTTRAAATPRSIA